MTIADLHQMLLLFDNYNMKINFPKFMGSRAWDLIIWFLLFLPSISLNFIKMVCSPPAPSDLQLLGFHQGILLFPEKLFSLLKYMVLLI
jgi:hypothetical protein